MLANMAVGARRINNRPFLTNRKLSSIHSESLTRSRSKAIAYSYAEKDLLRVVLCLKESLNVLPSENNIVVIIIISILIFIIIISQ